MLPNLFIVGAMRCGTTSLFRYFRQHPQIMMAAEKEPQYFAFAERPPSFTGPGDDHLNREIITDRARYEALFAAAPTIRFRGEASALYFYYPAALERIRTTCPDAHIVITLREPVARARSAWAYQQRRGFETLDWPAALDAEAQRIAAGWMPMWHYRTASLYGEALHQALQLFPRPQVHVVLLDDLEKHGGETLQGLFAGLGLEPAPDIPVLAYNRTGAPKSVWLDQALRPASWKRRVKRLLPAPVARATERWREANLEQADPYRPAAHKQLREFFRADVDTVAELLNRDVASLWGY